MEKKLILVYPNLGSMIGSYFVTITLKPEYYNRKVQAQYSLIAKPTVKLLKSYTDKILICPELTKKCNVHLHAIIKWTKRIDYPMMRLLNDIKGHKYIGSIFVTENAIQNSERARTAFEYMLEDYEKTRSVLQLPEILYQWEYKKKDIKVKQTIGNIDGVCKECEEVQGDTVIPKSAASREVREENQ